jgi:hypothetical protein
MGAVERGVGPKGKATSRRRNRSPRMVRRGVDEEDHTERFDLDDALKDALPDVQPPGRIKKIRTRDE